MVSLKLKNYGRSDAKDIIISTGFPKALVKPPTTSDDAYPCTVVTGGGKGEETVSVSVKRLVPDQTLYVYYVIADAKKAMAGDKASFVSGVTFEGGKGKAGEPIPLWFILANVVMMAILAVMYWRFRKRMERMDREAKEREEERKKCGTIWEERIQRRQEARQKQEKEREEAIQALITERDELRKKLTEAEAKLCQPPAPLKRPRKKPVTASPQATAAGRATSPEQEKGPALQSACPERL